MKIYRYHKAAFIALLLFAMGLSASAAELLRVSGTVTDDANEPLIGVSVVLKGGSAATATDVDGAFAISAPADGTLTFSYIGYGSRDVKIDGRSQINVVLAEESVMLDQVSSSVTALRRKLT